jgi:cysteine desulfurase/selenocysteine lyase|tara:strand:- start:3416 stop:4627 length:1212 start_codon:yes stop_codon:yes gene_type:complete
MDIEKIRKDFPILSRKIKGNDLIYFDNAATSQTPIQVINKISEYYSKYNSNIHRGVHFLSQEATSEYELVREKIKNHFNIAKKKEVIFTSGTTHGINLIASGYSNILQKGDEIIVSNLEHHSNIVPLQMLAEKTSSILKVIPMNLSGDLDLKAYKKLLNNKTKLVFVNHVSNSLGTINPIKEIIKEAHIHDAKVLIDGAQSAPHIKTDLIDLNADFYVTSAHKLCGPTGIGFLYGKEVLLNELPPYQGGGEMISEVTFEKTSYADLPHKFEAGTPNISGVIAFGAALDYLNGIGLKEIENYENELLKYATRKLKEVKGLRIFGEAKNKISVISFNIESIHPYDLGSILDKMGIAVRTGQHCAQPVMDFYQIPGTVRVSFSFYNTKKEIDFLILAINKAIKMLS